VFYLKVNISLLVGGVEHVLFSHILGIIIPTDYYFSEGLKPPTRFKCLTTRNQEKNPQLSQRPTVALGVQAVSNEPWVLLGPACAFQ
jgi:hypothetical protein